MSKQAKRLTLAAIAVVIIAAIVVAIVLVNNNSGTSKLSSTQMSAARKQITTNWQEFFAGPTPLAQREALLQNGPQFAQSMASEFSSLGSVNSSSTIQSISFTNSTTAKVVYSVYLNKAPVLQQQTGQALLINHTWVVSDSTLCQLLTLGGVKSNLCHN